MDLINYYRLRKLASDPQESTLGRKLSGVAGAVAGGVGADMLHAGVIRRSPKYQEFISGLARKSNNSPSRLGRAGAGLGLVALAAAPMALGAHGGYKTGTKLNDAATGRETKNI